jgi:hypothetical protein
MRFAHSHQGPIQPHGDDRTVKLSDCVDRKLPLPVGSRQLQIGQEQPSATDCYGR